MNRSAVPGDRVVFYMIRPMSEFVATGVVVEPAQKEEDRSSPWFGYYGAEVDDVQLLQRHVPLREAKLRFPKWAFLNQPRHSTQVPPKMAATFLAFLNAGELPVARAAQTYDIEGIQTEVVALRRSRSRRLRDQAFALANGVCAVCDRDYSKLLNGEGIRVLQVHHRNQLSARECPSVTRLEDLVVVCANCHLLLHLDMSQAMSVEQLRKLLKRDRV